MTENTNPDDLLGYDDYAHTLWARILAALNSDAANQKLNKKEQLLGDDPLVVGIFGEWGAGKSRLLQLIHRKAEAVAKERFAAHRVDSGMDLTVPVFFQPWKYEHESHLLVPLLMHILAELEQSLKLSQGIEEKLKQAFDKTGDKLVKAMPSVVSSFGNLIKGVSSKFAAADPTGMTAGLAVAAALAKYIAIDKKPTRKNAKDISFEDGGRSYYEIHEILKHITRPKKHKYTHPNYKIDQDIRINFVIFIDDLDRCLPEKAVETLELIKTIFNAESFAFVLALDEEVVERGIGHRYKDYTLVGKKPEMPITGFEYLEKIVHLPFRLPALTQAQAFNFLACYEEKLIAQRAPYSKKRDCWFQPKILSIPSSIKEFASREYTARQTTEDFSGWGDEKLEQNIDSRNLSLRRVTQAESITLNLAGLVIGSFNAFVPRKLIRVVELFHQVLDVLDIRNTSHMFTVGGEPKKTIDPRIAMANILLQLFQPELQRTLRRSKTGFDVLLNAFAPQTTDGGNMQLSSSKSDADLLHWAIYMAGGRQPPISLRSATMRMADITDEGQRYSSQRLLLVIVERLLEHRSIQRHAFDPLKLFETLQMSTHNGSLPLPDDTRWMSAMLSASADTMGDSIDAVLQVLTMQHQVAAVVADVTSAQSQTSSGVGQISNPKNNINIASVSNIDALFLALISPEEPEQKRVAEIAGLKEGQILNKAAVFKLVSAIETRFLIDIVEHGEDSDDSKSRKLRLLNGLKYLAPYIAKTDGGHLWSMVQGIVDVDKIPIEPKLRARWHDVRAALGQDNRFEGKYALPKRTDGDAPEAPAGFVLCPIPESGEYVFDDGDEMRPQKRQYYISRYAVTVAQYAAYVAADGYKDQALWEASHRDAWLWRTGEFDSSKTIEDKGYKEWLARRPADLRHQPMDWTEQLANLNRPVTGVTWFEATVYAAWLEVQRQKGDGGHDWGTLRDPPYRLRLPTEGEWERAARAGGAGKFPWGDDEADIDQRANVNDKVGHATTVGSYPPNALGLYDMAGNVWQWQANLYTNPYENKLILPKTPLKIGKDYQTSDTPARRGGSWFIHPDFARCSSRNWSPPDFWLFNLGFRLVLSLADFES